ncbi:hypothetical protein ACOI22_03575 [Glaciecola sp. 2405UD65-10]|uniref:hypothetical protein n=1 Tax=Glaciecola sp. 2405UD65-10 TaxID=3397244 RepID=UPI003B58E298
MAHEEYKEKLVSFATAPRVSAGQLHDKKFNPYWAGKLRGKYISLGGKFKFDTREEALNLAREYKQSCIDEAKKRGLM